MPDRRQHRGPHPRDRELFAPPTHAVLREAVSHLSWLLSRGYAEPSSLKLVGDRFHLTERQRTAVMRSSCSDDQRERRAAAMIPLESLRRQDLEIDGFNVLTTVEAALAGGVILHGRDGCYRDLASMHGNYRKVAETCPALVAIGRVLEQHEPRSCLWRLDRPVSNSGRLRRIIEGIAAEHGWAWAVQLDDDPDAPLRSTGNVVATADADILDSCGAWYNLARAVVQETIPGAMIVSLH